VTILAKILGKPIRCVDVPVESVLENFIRAGVPRMAAAVGESYGAVRNGRAVLMTDTVQKATGRPPMTFEAWALRHASLS
jgi:hypothetical protein